MHRSTLKTIKRLVNLTGALVEAVLEHCTEEEWQDLEDILRDELVDARALATQQPKSEDD